MYGNMEKNDKTTTNKPRKPKNGTINATMTSPVSDKPSSIVPNKIPTEPIVLYPSEYKVYAAKYLNV
jgi:hypothetical protein